MQTKVLATLTWLYRQPEGNNAVSLIFDDFDIHDPEQKIRMGEEALIQYGVDPKTIRFNENSLFYNFAFEAEIGQFHRSLAKGVKPYTEVTDVEVTFRYVQEHYGRIYNVLEEVDAFIVEPVTLRG